jgi:aspartyl-tRNA(Asn)/glutamyl-tRNA(Gln) amidotransferase subunit A
LLAYASSFDQIGIFSQRVSDAAKVLEVISGADVFDSTLFPRGIKLNGSFSQTASKPLRIAYFKEALYNPGLDKEISDSILSFISKLKKEGHVVEGIDFEFMDYVVPAYYILTTAEASSNLARYDGIKYGYRASGREFPLADFYRVTRSEGFGKEVKRRIMLGTFVLSSGYFDEYFTKAQKVRKKLIERTELIFNHFDAIILPNSPSTAFKLGEKMEDPVSMYLADIFTVFANLVGLPAISIPLFRHSNGMPFGLQIMTYQFSDLSLLQLSHQWMQLFRSSGK